MSTRRKFLKGLFLAPFAALFGGVLLGKKKTEAKKLHDDWFEPRDGIHRYEVQGGKTVYSFSKFPPTLEKGWGEGGTYIFSGLENGKRYDLNELFKASVRKIEQGGDHA